MAKMRNMYSQVKLLSYNNKSISKIVILHVSWAQAKASLVALILSKWRHILQRGNYLCWTESGIKSAVWTAAFSHTHATHVSENSFMRPNETADRPSVCDDESTAECTTRQQHVRPRPSYVTWPAPSFLRLASRQIIIIMCCAVPTAPNFSVCKNGAGFFYKVHPANRLMRATEGMKLNLLPSTDIPSNHTPAACSTSSSLQAISFRNVKSILSLIQYSHVNSAANSTYFANTCKWSIVKLTVFTASTSSYISHWNVSHS